MLKDVLENELLLERGFDLNLLYREDSCDFVDKVEVDDQAKKAMMSKCLSSAQKNVLIMYFFDEMTLDQIANKNGLTR